MKIKKLSRTILSVLVILSMLASIPVFAEEPEGEQQYTITEPYEYPVKPGTPEWKDLEDNVARHEACQIPEDTLTSIKTDALLDTILNYPYLVDMMIHSTLDAGYKAVKSSFNALAEFETRNDATDVILTKISTISAETDLIKRTCLEIIAAQDIFLENFNSSECDELAENIYNIYQATNEKAGVDNSYNGFYRALEQRGISTYSPTPNSSHTVISTPKGSNVYVYYLNFTTSPEDKASMREALGSYEGIKIVGDADYNYNCHAYAWYKPIISHYWMMDPSAYMSDGSYYEVSASQAKGGDRVYFPGGSDFEGTHSAIVNGYEYGSLWVTGKWGDFCVVKSTIHDGAFKGTPSYWRQAA